MLNDLVETIGELESQADEDEDDDEVDRLSDFVSGELKSSTRINFEVESVSSSSTEESVIEATATTTTINKNEEPPTTSTAVEVVDNPTIRKYFKTLN